MDAETLTQVGKEMSYAERSLRAIGRLALAVFIAWALTTITTTVARALGPGPVWILLLAFVALWGILKRSKR